MSRGALTATARLHTQDFGLPAVCINFLIHLYSHNGRNMRTN